MGSLVVYYGTLIDVSRINDLEGGIRFSLRYARGARVCFCCLLSFALVCVLMDADL